MLEARSVAVVGASARPDSFGQQLIHELERGGYEGDIFPVNPRYAEVGGMKCFPSLDDVPAGVALAILGVPNPKLEEQLALAGSLGIPAAVIFASCFEETPPGEIPLSQRLTAIASDAGMSVCGGNCMGFLNLERGLRACGYAMPGDMEPGHITFISHSGSAFAAFAYNDRRLRFNLLVSSGQEFVTTAADYLSYALRLESTRVVGMFLESVRDPAPFRAALADAAERDIPVVVLKVGRDPTARALVAAHSGALAGDDAAYEALFEAYGVMRVSSLGEMADVMELCAPGRRAATGGLASIHDSGGERAHFVDAGAEVGVRFAGISDETKLRLEAVLEEGLPAVNPLDAWGTGNDYESIYSECIDALMTDSDTAATTLCVDLTTEMYPEGGYVRVAKEAWATSTKPFALLSNLPSAIEPRDALSIRDAGIPILEGTHSGLHAFRHLFEYRDRLAPPGSTEAVSDEGRATRWGDRLRASGSLDEVETLALLGDYGIPVVESVVVSDAGSALTAASRIGGAVVLKTAAEGIGHKSDVGGVSLGLLGEAAVTRAYEDISRRLGERVIVSAMATRGMDMALGIVHDDQFGPLVMVAAGGILIELLGDRRFALPPISEERALKMVDSLWSRPLLEGLRGAPRGNVGALVRAVIALSQLAVELGDYIDALDVNPIIVGPQGAVAVDALLVPRTGQSGQPV
ncbi:MAG: acetate--CoA ligase family protein [Actinomycetota bacterium]|nr:acetate--CoA ligase family protein [Actinomycetota bacterium]